MALPAWPFYLLGSLVVFAGFLSLHRWLKGLTGRRGDPPEGVLPVAVLAFLLGSGTIVAAIALDSEQLRTENTRVFLFTVAVRFDGPAPIHLVLPAPVDGRLLPPLAATNGTSTFLTNRTGPVPVVEIDATENVTFSFRVEIVGAAFNTTLSRVATNAAPSQVATFSIRLADDDAAQATAYVRLDVWFIEFCLTTNVDLEAIVQEGLADYAGRRVLDPAC